MVKADVRRDYYADLGLTPSADGEDIKKQFRKLGKRKTVDWLLGYC
jgi:curved DNA-binding protein CbpA